MHGLENQMAQMFNIALQRLATGEYGQAMPVTFKAKQSGNEAPREVQGYELQWMERTGVDPEDAILCRYRVRDPADIKRMEAAFAKKQSIQALARA
jgi:hypothetical protein